MFFIRVTDIPKGRNATYLRVIAAMRPEKANPRRVRWTIGGDCIDYPDDVRTKSANLTTAKLLLNSTVLLCHDPNTCAFQSICCPTPSLNKTICARCCTTDMRMWKFGAECTVSHTRRQAHCIFGAARLPSRSSHPWPMASRHQEGHRLQPSRRQLRCQVHITL